MADIAITVSGTKYPLKVLNYQKTDITDFAPKSFTTTQSLSTLGLYTDATQDGFGHGFGGVAFSEPKSYHYSGHQVDTRNDFISLYTKYTEVGGTAIGSSITGMVQHGGVTFFCTANNGLSVVQPTSLNLTAIAIIDGCRSGISNGEYLFLTRSSGMIVADAGPHTYFASTFTKAGAAWSTNFWAGGTLFAFSPTSTLQQTLTVASNTATVITTTTTLTDGEMSYFIVTKNAGNVGNPPNNFYKLAMFGGSIWSYENGTNRVHLWSEANGSDAEGGTADAGVIYVGPKGGRGILNIAPFQNQLWVYRPDGVWTINEQDTDALAYHTLDFGTESSNSNFLTTVTWQGFQVFAVRNKLFKYRSGLQDITPPVWDMYPPYKQYGDFKGLTIRGKHLYVLGRSNEANSDESLETTTGFVSLLVHDGVGWHKLMDIPQTTPTVYDMFLDPAGDYLYIFSNPTRTLYRIPLQPYSDLPYASFATTGNHNLYTSYYDFTYKRVPKSFASVTLHGDFPSGTSVIVHYRVDDTLTWTSLGTFTTDLQAVNFVTGVTGKRIQFRLNLQTSNAANTPVIKAIVIKMMMRPAVLYGVYCDVQVSSNLANTQQRYLGLTSREIETALLAARDSVAPITFTDLAGVDVTAYLSSVKFRLVEYTDMEGLQYVAQCSLVYV